MYYTEVLLGNWENRTRCGTTAYYSLSNNVDHSFSETLTLHSLSLENYELPSVFVRQTYLFCPQHF